MSIIQKIRDKGALISAIVIALALLGFIAMDATSGRSGLFGDGNSPTSVGTVNGQTIGHAELDNTAKMIEGQMTQQGYPSGESTRQAALANAWTQQVNKLVLASEFKKVGISVSDKELNNDILFGDTAPEFLKQAFTDQQTGVYDVNMVYQRIKEIGKKGTPEQKNYISANIDQSAFGRMYEKYSSLLSNTINVPRWMIEKQNEDNSQMARISLVKKAYVEIADSAVKVTDEEIAAYINKHKDQFKQKESRSVAYVSFSAKPSSADTAAAFKIALDLKPQLQQADSIATFMNQQGQQYFDGYLSGKEIQIAAKDSIFKTSIGGVYGPFIDGNTYSIAKMLGSKVLPDSVKCRHVLIGKDPKDGGVDDSTGLKIIDSIKNAINAGANWAEMVNKYNPSSDGSRQTNGEMTFSSGQIQSESFAKEFGQFILFDGKVGEKKVVKTSFGYHFIEILAQKNLEAHYKVAYINSPIETGQETDSKASTEAAKFSSQSRNEKSFDEYFKKNLEPNGYQKGVAPDIKPEDYQATGLGISRSFVKLVYDAKRGEVLQPEKIGTDYVVAIVTEVAKEGTMSVGKARLSVEPILRNHKKAEQIKQQIGAISNLEAVATKINKPIELADSLRISGAISPVVAGESKVIGAAFNPDNRGKVLNQAIEGEQGVYVIRVDNVSATAQANASVIEQRKARSQELKQRMMYSSQFLQALTEDASVKDKRSKFF